MSKRTYIFNIGEEQIKTTNSILVQIKVRNKKFPNILRKSNDSHDFCNTAPKLIKYSIALTRDTGTQGHRDTTSYLYGHNNLSH